MSFVRKRQREVTHGREGHIEVEAKIIVMPPQA
jgi:hypothetical protein